MTRGRKIALILLVVAVACAGLSMAVNTQPQLCEWYVNSTIQGFNGTYICALEGGGCTTCWNTRAGTRCVTDGQSCVPW